jgi:S-DNA-T family DNA segregation ATPase FtsK/SpoIIIE
VSNDPGAGTTLELLDKLKSAIRDFVAREERLSQDHRAKLARERRQRDQAAEEQAGELAAEVAAEDTRFREAKASAEARYERRKLRISEARQASKDQTLGNIETKTGSRKYGLQKRMLQAESDRKAGLAATVKAFEDFESKLAAEETTLRALETAARHAFRGYGTFRRRLARAGETAKVDLLRDENQMLGQIHGLLDGIPVDLKRLRKLPLPLIFRFLPVWLLIVLCPGPIVLQHFQIVSLSQSGAMELSAACLLGVLGLFFAGRYQAGPPAGAIAEALGKARRLVAAAADKSGVTYHAETERIEAEFQSTTQDVDDQLKRTVKEDVGLKGSFRERVDEKTLRINAKSEKMHQSAMEGLNREHADKLALLDRTGESRREEFGRVSGERVQKLNADLEEQWQALEAEWNRTIRPIYAAFEATNALAQKLFPPWSAALLEQWQPPAKFEHAAKFAQLDLDVEKLCEGLPADKRLALPGPAKLPIPLLLSYPHQGCLLLETGSPGRDAAIGTLNDLILRLLSVAPPGRLNFTIIDPVGLGQNFAGVMHLADYEEQLINSRIWTQSSQIEQKLGDLNEHMEKIIQMYLRNDYATIAEYNEQAGDIAEKYHFLVIADFPANFSETSAKRLLSIAASGARCGVYTLIHWDRRQTAPQDFVPDQLRKSSICLTFQGDDFLFTGKTLPGTKLTLEPPPAQEFASEFIQKVGRASKDSGRVEVPFSHVAPRDAELWSEDTTNELTVAIGRTGATKLQYLAIGKGTRQHTLVAGKTGSGKSTLFHVMITNLALWCSPEQVEFYLIDFKKGVEFKCYGTYRLPHARVVAIESDREFGLSVLQRVDEELKRRGDLFRKLGVQDVAGYKRAGGAEPMPRSLLLIDEFQEFFVEDDKVSQNASVLLDRIVRQGRAFGIHVILGSQTLGGAYTLARTTIGQMVIRIALQCNEADAYLIMDDTNPAPRLLSRPGEGIYNDSAGAVEGNSPFQTVWLPEEVRDSYLEKVRAQADHAPKAYPGPIVFEGNAPADIRENLLLRGLLEAKELKSSGAPRIWLGAPNSIKGPTEAVFQRQSGNNLLIVGQREEAALAILSSALVALAAQHRRGEARFFLFDGAPPDSPQRAWLEELVQAIPHEIRIVRNNEVAEVMNGLAEEMKGRSGDEKADAPATFLFFNGLQRFNRLRYEEDFSFTGGDAGAPTNPAQQLNALICEGASLGFHTIVTCDTYNNVNRFLSRKAFSEFEMRVLFQMSANDSASLIDNPKANTLGLNRAVYYNEQEGYLEVFRPYALPDRGWVEQAGLNLKRLLVKSS